MSNGARTVTILFTDLVGSTELLQRQGDEQAQRIFKAHHRLLREAVEAHGGQEVKWLGDGLMVAFESASDAVKCAVAMQQASRRPTAGERLQIRAGLNVGEAFVDESDYFGTSVVVARRLCDRAEAGQIFAADIVARLLDGRGGDLSTEDLGPLELKGITAPVPAVEIVYQHDPMALLRKLPFVGRRAEYETLLGKLSEAQNGRGSVAMLAGEPGIGKTRLTEEFCEQASSSSTIIRGNCYEGDIAPPFGPWVEALRSLIDEYSDDELRDAVGEGAPEIAVLLPELRRRLPETGEALKLDPESERARIFGAVATFLKNVSGQKPLVVFLDDLHWSDRPSLLLLEYVARGVADQQIVIVGTYRDVDVDRVHPLAQTLAALRRMEHHERIEVKGFTEETVFELLTAIEPSEQTEPARRVLAGALFAEAEGNPFFIREVLNNLVESGKLFQRDGTWVSDAASIEELGIPEGVKEAVGRRLSRLGEGCNQMLGRASAFTNGFTWEELVAVSDEAEDELLDHLDEALGVQLIAEQDRGRYAFTHALVRATLYDELSTPRRVRLHRRVAESLESLYAGDIDAYLGELAAHYMASMGGEAEKAIDYSIRAGRRAMELVAWEEATAYFHQALEAMPEAGEEERRAQVQLDLASAMSSAGQRLESVDEYRRAFAAARAAGSPEVMAGAAIGFDTAARFAAVEASVAQERVELIDEALHAIGANDSGPRALLLVNRVRAAHALQHFENPQRVAGWGAEQGHLDPEALNRLREAAAMAERVGDPAVIASAIADGLFWYLARPTGGMAEKRAMAEKALEAGCRSKDWLLETHGWHSLFVVSLAQGDMDAVRQAQHRLEQIAGDTKLAAAQVWQVVTRAALMLAEGRLEEGEKAVFEAFATGQSNNDATAQIAFAGQLSLLRWYQGRFQEMEPTWRGLAGQSPDIEVFRAPLALALVDAGKTDEAWQVFDRLAAIGFENIPEDGQWMASMVTLAEVCYRIGKREGAAELYDVMSRYPDRNATAGNAICYGPIARYLGMVATVLGRWDDAERHFQFSIEMSERGGLRPSLADARMKYGDMLLRRNDHRDREKARELLQQALEAAQEMGAARIAADCERLLAGAQAQ
ncbi:MAG TPA: AAA family ATPase [Dehalococcoidia bacterium]